VASRRVEHFCMPPSSIVVVGFFFGFFSPFCFGFLFCVFSLFVVFYSRLLLSSSILLGPWVVCAVVFFQARQPINV